MHKKLLLCDLSNKSWPQNRLSSGLASGMDKHAHKKRAICQDEQRVERVINGSDK